MQSNLVAGSSDWLHVTMAQVLTTPQLMSSMARLGTPSPPLLWWWNPCRFIFFGDLYWQTQKTNTYLI